jgi:hypothetical protein
LGALQQGQQNAFFELMCCQKVNQRDRHLNRVAVFFASHVQKASFGLQNHVKCRTVIIRAISGDFPINQPGI